MYGWRGKIGLLLPARNTTMEPEFYRMAPEGVTTHATRMSLEEISISALEDLEKVIYAAALTIQALNPDVIVVGCTSGSFIKGAGYDSRMINRIKKQTEIEAITTSTAVIEALRILQIKKVAIATPYTDEVNEREKEFLQANGIGVVNIKGLGYSKPVKNYPLSPKPVSAIGLLEPYVAYRMARDVDTKEADGIFISCTNFRTAEIIQVLEKSTMKPVVTSNQASMWLALRKMGIHDKILGYGTLLEHFSKGQSSDRT